MDTSVRECGIISIVASILFCLFQSGCSTEGKIVTGVLAGTAYLAQSPGNEIEQIYYLGVFDPEDQLPPSLYRVRVHGQSSSFSQTRFASGWVRAELIDSLSSRISFDKTTGRLGVDGTDENQVHRKIGRRQILFGPEGFRDAPAGHRLAIVMGQSPESFFQAIDASLGAVSRVQEEDRNNRLARILFSDLSRLQYEDRALERLQRLGGVADEGSEAK
jgi:hypothetical protein